MSRITPPINTKGVFLLREPYAASPTTVYTVAAIRSPAEMISQGDNPLEMAYKSVNLSQVEYQADLLEGVLILTLLAEGKSPLYVPDTYIDSYPDMAVVPHSHMVAVISLGMLPDTYDTAAAEQAITTAVSDYTGVEVTVTMAKAPTVDAVTQEQYVQNLQARQAAVKNRKSTYADKLELQKLVDVQQEEILRLLSIIENMESVEVEQPEPPVDEEPVEPEVPEGNTP